MICVLHTCSVMLGLNKLNVISYGSNALVPDFYLFKFLEDHGLKVGDTKSVYMFLPFSDAQVASSDIKINGNIMPKCASFKYLRLGNQPDWKWRRRRKSYDQRRLAEMFT